MCLAQTSLKIKTLTPLWTGGVNTTTDRLHETGIVGSLRWWYEAVVRGLGGYACDPTDNIKCELSGKEKSNAKRLQKLCPACYLFGCGGWKRRFRLEVINNSGSVSFQLTTLNKESDLNHWWLSQIFEGALGANLPFGEVSLNFEPTASDVTIKQLKALLSIMAHIGAIGAKTQYGFGQFDWKEKMELKEAIDAIQKFLKDHEFKQGLNKAKWYSLDKFWFLELELSLENKKVKRFQEAKLIGNGDPPQIYLPVSFDIRYKLPGSRNGTGLRQAYYLKHRDKRKTREIFGTLLNDKIGSRVFVSHLFKKDMAKNNYCLRVWGFTEDSIGNEVGEELKKMFALEEVPLLKTGKEILGTEAKNDF